MHNQESVLENGTNKLQWDFDIQTDHLISARRPDLIIINKKERTCRIVDFLSRWTTKYNWKNAKSVISVWTLIRNWKNYGTWNWGLYQLQLVQFWHNHQRIGTNTKGLRNNGTDRDCPNYSIIKIGQNTEKSLGDLRRLAVTQTPVENYQLMLIGKTLQESNNNEINCDEAKNASKFLRNLKCFFPQRTSNI